jgi:hypothetical protein
MPRALSVVAGLLLTALPVAAQTGAITSALTPEQIAASEALAAKYDQSAAKEQARLATFKNRPLGAVIQRSFNVFSNYVTMAAEMMPESAYAFRPTADVRTFGEQINHATGSHYSFCNQGGVPPGATRKTSPNLREVTSKAAIIQALKDSVAYCDGILAAASEAWLQETAKGLGGSSSGLIEGMRAHAFLYNNVHLAEDYGTITTYMRMQGVVPPSTASHPPAAPRLASACRS